MFGYVALVRTMTIETYVNHKAKIARAVPTISRFRHAKAISGGPIVAAIISVRRRKRGIAGFISCG